MNTIHKKRTLWKKLAKTKAYRDAFVAVQFKRWLPFQVRVMREKRGWNQAKLAEFAGLQQGVISRAENPDYGNLTINTILKIAAGFDCAFEGRFVPFSRLATTFANQSEGAANVLSFSDEVYPEDSSRHTGLSVTTTWMAHYDGFVPVPAFTNAEILIPVPVINNVRTVEASQEA